MTYDPDIPAPADLLSVSQGDLLENFDQLNTQFGVNHVEFDDPGANKGKHKFCSFVEQANDPAAQADEYLLYSKQDVSGDTELYLKPEAAGGASYQMTKDGSLYLGLIPFVAVNFNVNGVHQGASIGAVDPLVRGGPGYRGRYTLTLTAAAQAQLTDSNYFWSVSGFDNSNNPVIAQVKNDNTYADSVDTTRIIFDFKNQNLTLIDGLVRACAICWRIQ